MNTAFLNDHDLMQVQSIMASHGLTGFDAAIRLWGRGKAIDVNGTLGKRELSCLLAIARYLGDRPDEACAEEAAAAGAPSYQDFLPYVPPIKPIEAQA